ncbi:MAG TPA: hypothetical protein VHM20_01180 [Gammaproteobacteria bacterium]|nr:hypothetical protein [Gammaproteobacteria bacterium]
MNLEWMLYLQKQGYLTLKQNKILDIGPQNIYFATHQQVENFLINQGIENLNKEIKQEIDRIIYFPTPRPEERTSFLSELTDLTNIEYNSFDICPGLKTEILDLNYDNIPKKYLNYYDIILNFGTTEHVFNQWNSYKLMHEATKLGGIFYHQLPGTGYLDHGYFCYTPIFFHDLAKANRYEILDLFFTHAGQNELAELGIEVRADRADRKTLINPPSKKIHSYNINVILRKNHDAPFRCGMEIATSHSAVDARIMDNYTNARFKTDLKINGDSKLENTQATLAEIKRLTDEIKILSKKYYSLINSRSWKITKPMRVIKKIISSTYEK